MINHKQNIGGEKTMLLSAKQLEAAKQELLNSVKPQGGNTIILFLLAEIYEKKQILKQQRVTSSPDKQNIGGEKTTLLSASQLEAAKQELLNSVNAQGGNTIILFLLAEIHEKKQMLKQQRVTSSPNSNKESKMVSDSKHDAKKLSSQLSLTVAAPNFSILFPPKAVASTNNTKNQPVQDMHPSSPIHAGSYALVKNIGASTNSIASVFFTNASQLVSTNISSASTSSITTPTLNISQS